MFDTHAHLNLPPLFQDVRNVTNNAVKAGVNSILIPSVDLKTSKVAIRIALTHSRVYASVGIHPSNSKFKSQKSKLKLIEQLIQNKKVVAVGEVGLDAYHTNDKTVIQNQKVLFTEQLKLAIEYKKTVIIHSRNTTNELLEVLTAHWNKHFSEKMVFHCCEADKRLLNFALRNNIYIGVDGDVTYNIQKQEFIKLVPLHRLVLETDSPYLTPEPIRKTKRFPNEPANLIHIAQKISLIKSVPLAEVIQQTTKNAKMLLNIRKQNNR